MAIAGALNAGELARAQIATVLLGIPDPPQLFKGAAAPEQAIKLIRDLHWSGLLKWDPDEHPRWPAGQSDGGEFRPAGDSGSSAIEHEQPRQNANSSHEGSSRFWPNLASTLAAGAVEVAGNVAIGAEEIGTEGVATPAVPAEEAGLAAMAREAATEAAGAVEGGEAKTVDAVAESVWRLPETQRGIVIEQNLAATDYADWYWVGQEDNGYFPLVDFQRGDTLVSLRTVDTNGVSWFNRIASHIKELGESEARVDDRLANMVLDLRVQPGGLDDAQSLAELGIKRGVTVRIREFP